MSTPVLVLLILAAWLVLSFVLGLVVARVLRAPRITAVHQAQDDQEAADGTDRAGEAPATPSETGKPHPTAHGTARR